MPPNKPYRSVLIRECGERMVPIPQELFIFANPHPYIAAGAPYGNASPWMLRETIVESLISAQKKLSRLKPGWKIKLMDGYRPNAVQAYMVELEFERQAVAEGLNAEALSPADKERLAPKVFRLWGIPSEAPATPPPHSTGAAFDCTLADENGLEIIMGSPFDENSPRSMPDAFADAKDPSGLAAHANRTFLNDLLNAEGFVRNPSEWWHFSRGDQLAIWCINPKATAIYGKAPL